MIEVAVRSQARAPGSPGGRVLRRDVLTDPPDQILRAGVLAATSLLLPVGTVHTAVADALLRRFAYLLVSLVGGLSWLRRARPAVQPA